MAFYFTSKQEYSGFLKLCGDLNSNSFQNLKFIQGMFKKYDNKIVFFGIVPNMILESKLSENAKSKLSSSGETAISINFFNAQHEEWQIGGKDNAKVSIKPTEWELGLFDIVEHLQLFDKPISGALTIMEKPLKSAKELIANPSWISMAYLDYELVPDDKCAAILKSISTETNNSNGSKKGFSGETLEKRIDTKINKAFQLFGLTEELPVNEKFDALARLIAADTEDTKVKLDLLKLLVQ